MKCSNCGAELSDGVKFCRECGTKAEQSMIRFCRECGEKITDGAKFCSVCGAKTKIDIEAIIPPVQDIDTEKRDNLYHTDTLSNSTEEVPSSEESSVTEESAVHGEKISEEANNFFERISKKLTSFVKKADNILETDTEQKKKYNKKNILILAIAALVLIAIVAAVIEMDTNGRTESNTEADTEALIEVIDVIGEAYPDAMKVLQEAGFTNIVSNVENGTDEALWTVTDQSVSAGELISAGDKIELTCAMQCKLYLDITSETNAIFSTYDITVSLDGKEIGSVANGAEFTYLADLLSGEHELVFCKSGNTEPKATKNLSLTNDMTYSCKLTHDSSSISMKNEKIESNVANASLEVVDVTEMILSEAISVLENIGFSNLKEKSSGNIWDEDNWIVTGQNLAAGTIADKNELIQLDCISLNDYFSNNYVGKNVNDIQKHAEEHGFSLRFEDSSRNDLNSKVSVMDESTKVDWIVTGARQYTVADKTAMVTIEYTREVIENTEVTAQSQESTENDVTDIETAVVTECESTTTEATTKQSETQTTAKSTMPVMTGTSLDTVMKTAKDYGLSRKFSDEDFGHGTKMCALSNSNGGLTLDVIYCSSTKEVLCGSIVTFNKLASASGQKAFIKAMAAVLCPKEDKTKVVNWVKSNVGSSKETSIGGFDYEVGLGPTGNALYYAGQSTWENWDLSF